MIAKRFVAIIVVACFLIVTAAPAWAHSGGTDSGGCHAGSRPYHCHNSKGGDSNDTVWIILGGILAVWLVYEYVLKPILPMPHADLSDIQEGDGKLSWKWRF